MWDAKPEYWKRTSPVLFPIVGSLNNGSYTYRNKQYSMSQHGFARDNTIISSEIGENGTLLLRKKGYVLKSGYMNITKNLFDEDALIIENNQAHKVSLCNKDGKPYLTVKFDAPLFGLWSPAKKNAPFICIEPWYGRGDKAIFTGDLSQREWGNKLSCNEKFNAEYSIIIE